VLRIVVIDAEHVCFAADLAVFHVPLPAPGTGIDGGTVPLSAASALKTRIHIEVGVMSLLIFVQENTSVPFRPTTDCQQHNYLLISIVSAVVVALAWLVWKRRRSVA
jgi:hypothetical protein